MMKKMYIIIISIFLLCIGITKLYTAANPIGDIKHSQNEENKTKIRIGLNLAPRDRKNLIYQDIINNYNKEHNNVVLETNYVPGNDYFSRLKVDFASGNEADIFITCPGKTTNKFAEKGQIVDLKSELDKDRDWYNSFNKGVWKYVTNNDKIVGVPLMTAYAAFFANTDVLEKANAEVPKTYEQLKKLIPILKKQDIVPIAFDMSDDGLLMYSYIAALMGGRHIQDNISDFSVPNEYYARSAEYVKELYSLGAFSQDLFSVTKKQCDEMFLSKKAAFIIRYSDFLENIDRERDFETVSVNTFPIMEDSLSLDKAILYGVGSDALFISSKNWGNEKMREKLISVVKYFTSQENAYYITENLGSISAVKIRTAATKTKNMIYQRNCDFVAGANQIIEFSSSYIDSDVLRHIGDKFPLFLEGKMNINDVWEYSYRYVNGN